jgi:phage terminase large subunit-like protein
VDTAAADRACEYFEVCLRHSKGEWAGQPFVLDPWQRERIIRPLFGLKRDDTGFRWYSRCDVWLPRKNGKSTLAAGVGLYLTTADGEPSAEVYSVANDLDQARICWVEASRMVKASPELSEMCQVFNGTSAIIVPETLSSYQAVGSDIGDKDGLNPHGVIADELHEWKHRALLAKLTTAQSARRQPLTFVISTAGENLSGVGYAEYTEDKRILKGKSRIRDRLVVIYEAMAGESWRSRKTWKAANPGYGKTVKVERLESELRVAETDPVKEGDFKRYYLNIWTSQTASSIPMEKWAVCGAPFDPAMLAGKECYIGMDLAQRSDLTAVAAVFRIGEEMYTLPHFFVPETGLELRERRDGVPYRQWARAGLVTVTPGDVTDYSFVEQFLLEQWARTYQIREIAYDPYNATHIATLLQDNAGLTMVEMRQNAKNMAPAATEFKNLIIAGRFRHGNNPVLNWMAGNARSKRDAYGNERIVKGASTGKIDGLIAILMALARSTLPGEGPSVYQTRGLISL